MSWKQDELGYFYPGLKDEHSFRLPHLAPARDRRLSPSLFTPLHLIPPHHLVVHRRSRFMRCLSALNIAAFDMASRFAHELVPCSGTEAQAQHDSWKKEQRLLAATEIVANLPGVADKLSSKPQKPTTKMARQVLPSDTERLITSAKRPPTHSNDTPAPKRPLIPGLVAQITASDQQPLEAMMDTEQPLRATTVTDHPSPTTASRRPTSTWMIANYIELALSEMPDHDGVIEVKECLQRMAQGTYAADLPFLDGDDIPMSIRNEWEDTYRSELRHARVWECNELQREVFNIHCKTWLCDHWAIKEENGPSASRSLLKLKGANWAQCVLVMYLAA
ncbi:uncharacterized protein TRUGW13939_05906 [Talaromyces rugulosus]|uniref:Uncharacterized protein n=1 Tax=Talaromyces rugulosus TaxID=121627 RepID=A0A7H8QXI8_TALRU|nr:uncharacterized protein TRUGW13939_05906 [Talaromyces rugulosus]QKX58779.1 hypothetical protein TRUGW13939_05906 [Talaromyces rugulosus]